MKYFYTEVIFIGSAYAERISLWNDENEKILVFDENTLNILFFSLVFLFGSIFGVRLF